MKKNILFLLTILFVGFSSLGQDISFTTHIVDESFPQSAGIFIKDIDQDGNNDIIAASVDDHIVAWWHNSGEVPPDWEYFEIDNSFNGAIYVFSEDIDGDNDPDVIAAGWDINTVAWWRNDGGNPVQWTKFIIDNNFLQAHEVMAFDVDKDGIDGCTWRFCCQPSAGLVEK